jgi:hypothetical protein
VTRTATRRAGFLAQVDLRRFQPVRQHHSARSGSDARKGTYGKIGFRQKNARGFSGDIACDARPPCALVHTIAHNRYVGDAVVRRENCGVDAAL